MTLDPWNGQERRASPRIDGTCAYHDDTRILLAELNTSSKWLVRLIGGAILLVFPVMISIVVYMSKLETRVYSLETNARTYTQELAAAVTQIKNQRNMDHPNKDKMQ